jgi:hypothetical protein
MSHRKILTTATFLSVVLLLTGIIFRYSVYFKLCSGNDYNCINFWTFILGHTIVLGLIPLIPILIILQFFRREVFVTWGKFAVVLVPVIVLMIYNTPVQCNAPLGLCFDKKSITRFLSEGFAILSLIIILTKSFLIRRKEKSNSPK